MGIIQYIDVVRIPVKDLKRATHFYSVGLGLDFQFELDKCSYFSLGNTQIILDSKIENTSSYLSYFLNHEKIIEKRIVFLLVLCLPFSIISFKFTRDE